MTKVARVLRRLHALLGAYVGHFDLLEQDERSK